MYRIFKSKKDTYITNRVINGQRKYYSNVGNATTLDLYKIYGLTYTNGISNIELSRILIDFDLTDLINDYNKGLIDVTDPTFNCVIKLFGVQSGQTTPSNFSVICYPLAKEFSEGIGNDIVYFQDLDAANFISASNDIVWGGIGANLSGTYGSTNIDIIRNHITEGDFFSTFNFISGKENLEIDVTKFMSASLSGIIENKGFRLSFIEKEELDDKSRFVKRFASRNAKNPEITPQMIVKYDDSIIDNSNNFTFDYSGSLFLYNSVRSSLRNVISSSQEITGSNCILLKLSCDLQSGSFEQIITGSQFILGNSYKDGIYYANFVIDQREDFIKNNDDTVTFKKQWLSLNEDKIYSDELIKVNLPYTNGNAIGPNKYYVNIINSKQSYDKNEVPRFRLHIEKVDNPYVFYQKTPFIAPSYTPEKVYYRVKNAITKEIIIPFDVELSSTRLSNDKSNMFFDFHMLNLNPGLTYEFDILIIENDIERIYDSVCSPFTINTTDFSINVNESSRVSMPVSRNQQVYLYLQDYEDRFTTTQEQSIFNLTFTPFQGTLPLVYVGGIYQSNLYYTIIGSTLTFGENVDPNTQVEVIYKYRP